MSQWETRVKVIGLADSKQPHAFSSHENGRRLPAASSNLKSIEASMYLISIYARLSNSSSFLR